MKPADEVSDVVRRFYERLEESGYYKRKIPVVTIPISQRLAEAIKANPEGLVLYVRAADGSIVPGRPTGKIIASLRAE